MIRSSCLKLKHHLEILDDFAGEGIAVSERKAEGNIIFTKPSGQTEKLLSECRMNTREKERALSLASFEAEEIEEAPLREGEDEELEDATGRWRTSRRIAEVW